MDVISFNWDETTSLNNKQEHRILFEEAEGVFFDESARLIADPDSLTVGDGLVLLGLSKRFRILVVAHSYLQRDAIVHIVAARKATIEEQQLYIQKVL